MVDSDLVVYCVKVIQRQLEEVGEKQKNLEERGVTIEKVLRGESPGEPRCVLTACTVPLASTVHLSSHAVRIPTAAPCTV